MKPRSPFVELLVMECVLRLRRPATGALFLILSGAAYLTMPDVTQGRAVFLIGHARVFLDSHATSFATASLGSLLLGLFGFYLAGNAITRDAGTRVGHLIAATRVSSGAYLTGKFAGTVLYLAVVSAAFMMACMGMHLLRGEAPLQPLVFLVTYGIFFLPLLPFLAGIALLFESLPQLSGRGGDFLYFFIWMGLLAVPGIPLGGGKEPAWVLYLDPSGMGYSVMQMARVAHSTSFSIGTAPFDPTRPPVFFPGLDLSWDLTGPRLASSLLALPLLAGALAAFQRFDPARAVRQRGSRRLSLSRLAERLTAFPRTWLLHHGWRLPGRPSVLRAAVLDARLSLSLSPFTLVTVLIFALAGALAPLSVLCTAILPLTFLLLVPLLAAVPTRERSSNLTGLLFSVPLLKEKFVLWKLLSAFIVALAVALLPLARLAFAAPGQGLSLLIGLLFTAATATGLGVMTGSPRTFAVFFLLFLYLAISSRGVPGFDFAGWTGTATTVVKASYAGIALLLVLGAWALDLRRGRC